MAKKGVLLTDKDENFLYPQTILEMVTNKEQTATLDVLLRVLRENLESDIEDTNTDISILRDELNALISDETLSGEVRDAILEINSLLNGGSSDITSEVVTTIRQLKENAVLHSQQSLTSSQKLQARQNIDAAGVSATYGESGSWATLSYNGNAVYPETKGKQVKLSNGSNVEDAINTNTSNISTNTENIKEKIGLVGSPTIDNGVQSGTLGYKNSPLYPTTRDNKVFVQSKNRTLDVVINDIETDISKEETRAQQTEMYLESQKADKSGYYENLSVGVADNLSGRGEATESEFSFRPSGGENKSIEDGTARINSIRGNSVVWNCEYKNGSVATKMNISDGFLYRGASYISLSQNKGDKIYICQTLNNKVDLKANANSLTRTFGYDSANKTEIVLGGVSNTYVTNPSFFTKGVHAFATIHTVGDYAINTIYCDLQQEDGITDYSEYSVKLVNLTKMFNGVNVPATVEEFESLYSNMPNEYNEGTIIDNHTSAIKSVGVNAWDEEWENGVYSIWNEKGDGSKANVDGYIRCKNHIPVIPNMTYSIGAQSYASQYHIGFYDGDKNYITFATFIQQTSNYRTFTTPPYCHYITFYTNHATYNHDICINLVHTGYLNGKYFPYESQTRQLPTVEGGLKGAGTAYDEIRYNKSKDKWEHVQRVGSVDLGTLEWQFLEGDETSNNRFATLSVLDNAKSPAYGERPNVLCAKYKRISPYEFYGLLSADLGVGISQSSAKVILLDKQYNDDVVALKASLQGVILNYELATPIVTELDVDISPDYKVWDYGTEEAISEVLSTPVRTNANYGFNAVGQITDNTELIKELLARVAVLEAQLAQQTNAAALVQDVDE